MKARITSILVCCLPILSGAQPISLDAILDEMVEKNPAIQQAKISLEEATGHRLVFRSIVWPSVTAQVPAGVQGGYRAGQNTIQPFALGQGSISQPLFDAAIPASLR